MSILGTIYTSMSGLATASQGLDNLSNNVANINTPGYKATDVFFRSLGGNSTGHSPNSALYMESGQGAEIGGSSVRFTQGDVSETGVATDMAVEGNGLFILRNDQGEQLYTRSGQFRFNEEGYLVDPSSGYRVAALDGEDRLIDINVNDFQTQQFNASTLIELEGGLNAELAIGETLPAQDAEPLELEIIDQDGASHVIDLTFTKLSGNRWEVAFLSKSGAQLQSPQVIEFNTLGTPLADSLRAVLNFQDFEYLSGAELEGSLGEVERTSLSDGFTISVEDDARLVVRDDGDLQFVEDSRFGLSDAGSIVSLESGSEGAVLAGVDNDNGLVDFDLSDLLTMPGQATSVLTLNGALNREFDTVSPERNGEIVYPPLSEPAISFTVHDSAGELVDLSIRFEKETASGDLWSVLVADESDLQNTINGTVNRSLGFDSAGNLLNSSVDVEIELADGRKLDFGLDFSGGEQSGLRLAAGSETTAINILEADGYQEGSLQDIAIAENGDTTLFYSNGQSSSSHTLAVVAPSNRAVSGVEIDFSRVVSSAGVAGSTVVVSQNDGSVAASLTSIAFLRDGNVEASYSNGDKQEIASIALANFSNPQLLKPVDKTMYKNVNDLEYRVGRPDEGAFGTLISNSLELSNVDLSKEFADIIIVQRSYQASSQVLNVSNELIEELYNSMQGR